MLPDDLLLPLRQIVLPHGIAQRPPGMGEAMETTLLLRIPRMPIIQKIVMEQGSPDHLRPVHILDVELLRQLQTGHRHMNAVLMNRDGPMLHMPSGGGKLRRRQHIPGMLPHLPVQLTEFPVPLPAFLPLTLTAPCGPFPGTLRHRLQILPAGQNLRLTPPQIVAHSSLQVDSSDVFHNIRSSNHPAVPR